MDVIISAKDRITPTPQKRKGLASASCQKSTPQKGSSSFGNPSIGIIMVKLIPRLVEKDTIALSLYPVGETEDILSEYFNFAFKRVFRISFKPSHNSGQ